MVSADTVLAVTEKQASHMAVDQQLNLLGQVLQRLATYQTPKRKRGRESRLCRAVVSLSCPEISAVDLPVTVVCTLEGFCRGR